MPVQLNNVAAQNKKLQQPLYQGPVRPTPDYFIRASVKGEKYTVIEFHPNRLAEMLEKYPNGLFFEKNGPKP